MEFALMFDSREGGDTVPINWSKDQFQDDRSIIVLDESSLCLYLWHGTKQGLVARRTALRQAESLKGHGFTVGKSIIGRDIKVIKEIDSRKVGRVPEEDVLNNELQAVLNKPFKEVDSLIVTFQVDGLEDVPAAMKSKPAPKAEPKPEPKPIPKAEPKPEPKPIPKAAPAPAVAAKPAAVAAKPAAAAAKPSFASEYDSAEPMPTGGTTKPAAAAPKLEVKAGVDLKAEARVAFVIMGVLHQFDDIWISKKDDGSYSIEMMDGPVCGFSIHGDKVKFSSNSFSGVGATIKSAVQGKFAELSNLI